jgi:hypothetical protein
MSRLEPRSAPFRRNTSHLVKAVLLRGSSAFRPGHFSLHCPGGLEGQEPTGTEPTGTELTGTRNQPAGGFVGNGNQRRLGLLMQREPTGKGNQQARGTALGHRPSAFFLGTLKPAAVLTPKVISLISSPSDSKRGDDPGPGPSGTMPKVPRQPSNSLGFYGEIEDSTLQLPPEGL